MAATLASLLLSTEAQAWGVAHVGYTGYGAGGAYHYGRTVGVSPYGGMYSAGRVGGYGGYGGYHYGYGTPYGGVSVSGGGYHYTPSYYGGAYGGGVRYGYGYRY